MTLDLDLLAAAAVERLGDLPGPTDADLWAIEAEGPVIDAEVALVDAECQFAAHATPFTLRRLRRAQAALLRANTLHHRPYQIGA